MKKKTVPGMLFLNGMGNLTLQLEYGERDAYVTVVDGRLSVCDRATQGQTAEEDFEEAIGMGCELIGEP